MEIDWHDRSVLDEFDNFLGLLGVITNICPGIGNSSKASTGEHYITMTHAGIKKEGEALLWTSNDLYNTVRAYKENLTDYIREIIRFHQGKPPGKHVLYWRCKPRIEYQASFQLGENGWFEIPDSREYKIISRLVVSWTKVLNKGGTDNG